MKVVIPEVALVLLIGTSGSGKSSFARRHFKPTEVISSDHCRALVSDDENDQSATKAAFEIVHLIAAKRLELQRLAVIDATNVLPESRSPLLQLAREFRRPAIGIVFDLSEQICSERNNWRTERVVAADIIHQQFEALQLSLSNLAGEGFHRVFVLKSTAEVDQVFFERVHIAGDVVPL